MDPVCGPNQCSEDHWGSVKTDKSAIIVVVSSRHNSDILLSHSAQSRSNAGSISTAGVFCRTLNVKC